MNQGFRLIVCLLGCFVFSLFDLWLLEAFGLFLSLLGIALFICEEIEQVLKK